MTPTTSLLPTTPLLRAALTVDATASTAMGLLLVAGAPALTGLLGLPEALLRGAGLSLIPFVALVAFLAASREVAPRLVWAVIGMNVLWVAESAWLLLGGHVQPTALGTAFVIAQALAVAGFAEAEYLGLRRATAGTLA